MNSFIESRPPISYSDFIKQAQPLDLVFFRSYNVLSESIELAQEIALGKGEFSHVGLIINRTILPDLNVQDDDLYLWESTLSSNTFITPDHILDAESKKPVFGVQIRKLADIIKYNLANKTINCWAPLLFNPTINYNKEIKNDNNENILDEAEINDRIYKKRLKELKEKLMDVHEDYYHRPYQGNFFRMIGALYPKLKCLRGKGCLGKYFCCLGKNWVFCSELVTIIYQAIGLVGKEIDASLVAPQDIIQSSHYYNNESEKSKYPIIIQDPIRIEKDN